MSASTGNREPTNPPERGDRGQEEPDAGERCRALAAVSPSILWTAPDGGRVVSAIPGWEAFTGQSFERYGGLGWLDAVHPEDRGVAGERWGRPPRDGTPVEAQYRLLHRDGGYRRVEARSLPLLAEDGGVREWVGAVTEVETLRSAQEALRTSERRLRLVVDSAADALFVHDLEGRFVFANRRACESLGYSREELLGLRVEDVEMDLSPGALWSSWREMVPGETVAVEGTHRRKDGSTFPIEARVGLLEAEGGPLLMALARDVTERRRVEGEREELLRRERRARAEAEAARDRLDFLAEASRRLASSLDYESTLEEVARLAVPRTADLCIVDVVCESGLIRRLGVAHPDPVKEELAWELERRYPVQEDPESRIAGVIRTGEPVLVPEVTELHLEDMAPDDGKLEILKKMEFSSLVIAPLVARGRTLGAISLFAEGQRRRYGSEDLSLAEDLGRRAAQAIDNARLHYRQMRTASALQRSLLPPRLPEIPGIETAARYRPAGEGNEVGGDFYDLFGRPAGWAVAIGDVVGKGPEAAELTALARYTVRTAAMQEQEPSRVLSTLNAALLNQRSDGRFCTMVYGHLLPNGLPTGGARLELCCGGHPLPLVLRAGGSVETAGEHGMLLGSYPDILLHDRRVELAGGDVVLFYTDGVTEARGPEGELFGEERLAKLLASCAGRAAEEVAEEIDSGLSSFSGSADRRDDVAFLVLRIAPGKSHDAGGTLADGLSGTGRG
ncbi:MAG: SpoIIE family protein phosphatase [Rubrobacter sp.]|nr:SpoIIE family protein phosphatase [Rubrobacter sp.]